MKTDIPYSKDLFVGKVEGKLLDTYDVIKELGSGGYGKVYEIKNKTTGDIRACKHLSKLNIQDLEKFRREIDILIHLDHPNIIKLYEIFESKNSFYLVMEQCKGGEVFDKIIERFNKKKMYSEKDAARIIQQVVSAIEYCHNKGICHRDLKPENLLYLNKGDEKNNPIKVIDFGLSQLFDKSKKKLTSKVGSSYYISPETLEGAYSEKCDIWSTGVILYILLSGIPPFNGSSDHQIFKKIKDMNFSFPEERWSHISEDAKDLIKHMLAPEKERYSPKDVLNHKWIAKHEKDPIDELPFDENVFKEYYYSSSLKKMTLMIIAAKLNENKIKELKDTFLAFDKDKDGQISFDEFKESIIKFKPDINDENVITKIFNMMDASKTGKIDYTEFIAATLDKQIYLEEERLYEAFSAFDKNGDGFITKDEIMSVLKVEIHQIKDAEEIIKQADKDGDGKINYKEFAKHIMGE